MRSLNKKLLILFIGCCLLQNCNSPQKTKNMNSSSYSSDQSLLQAVENNDQNLVANLLKAKPDLEIKDSSGRTPLMIAAYKSNNEIAKMLISGGADVNAKDNMQNSPFLLAGATGNIALLNLALANKADFNIYNRYGGTALIPAAEKGHLEAVKLLCKVPNFPIDHVNKLGWTALMEAVILSKPGKTQIEIIKTLVEAGADINIADNDGVSPLQHAKDKSLTEIIKILSEAANSNSK